MAKRPGPERIARSGQAAEQNSLTITKVPSAAGKSSFAAMLLPEFETRRFAAARPLGRYTADSPSTKSSPRNHAVLRPNFSTSTPATHSIPIAGLLFARNCLISRTVKWNSVTFVFASLLLVSVVNLSAQSSLSERKEFEAVKARAEKGDAQAQFDLGSLYAAGTGVTRDERKAVKWHRKAAEQGLPRAQFALAREYFDGDGIKPDKTEAFRWFRRAADKGMAEAQFELGRCYANGYGVGDDVVEAVRWYRKAAAQNLPEAAGEIGNCYLEGLGVTTDTVEGVKWIRQAADLGYAPAQNRLGLCYLTGQGVAKDLVQAYKWFNLGAAQGGELAADIKVNLAKAGSKMTPEQIAEAQRAALQFKPGLSSTNSALPATGSASPASLPQADSSSTGAGQGGVLSVGAPDVTYEVYIDGSFVGNPVARLRLPEGSHVVEVKKPGFKDYRKEINVANGAELNLHVTLEKE